MNYKYKYKVYVGTSANETMWGSSFSNECEIMNVFRGSTSYLFSFIRQYITALPPKIWIRNKSKNDLNIPLIVMIDSGHTLESLAYHIKDKASHQRYVFYYWNTVAKSPIKPEDLRNMGYEVWSFDKGDCIKYDLLYNPTFYFDSWYVGLNHKRDVAYDVYYIGRDKNHRADKVDEIKSVLTKHNMSVFAYHTAAKWYKRFSDKRYKKYVNFQKMLSMELQGKAILDIVIDNQFGPTLRVFDALCNGRKLITNNLSIKDMRCYSPQNVFIWGEDSEDRLKQFVDSPFDAGVNVDYYRFEEWLKRFSEPTEQ